MDQWASRRLITDDRNGEAVRRVSAVTCAHKEVLHWQRRDDFRFGAQFFAYLPSGSLYGWLYETPVFRLNTASATKSVDKPIAASNSPVYVIEINSFAS